MDLTEVITAAVEDVHGHEPSAPEVEVADVSTDTDTNGSNERVDTSAGSGDGSTGEKAAPVVAAPVDGLAAELESFGIKAPVEGQRENRIPYSRMTKIFENAKKKWEAEHTPKLTAAEKRATDLEKIAAEYNRNAKAADEDPDRYLQMLAIANPKYKKYTQLPTQEAPKPAPKPEPLAAEPPGPDHKFEDGSVGYTPEGYKKREDWLIAKAKQEAVEEADRRYTERFGAIEQEWKANQVVKSLQPRVDAQLARVRKVWGKDFDDDYALGEKSEVYQFMTANPDVPFESAVATVLQPRLKDSIRKSVLDELDKRAAGATKTAPAPNKTAAAPEGPRTMEDIIREAIAPLKRN